MATDANESMRNNAVAAMTSMGHAIAAARRGGRDDLAAELTKLRDAWGRTVVAHDQKAAG